MNEPLKQVTNVWTIYTDEGQSDQAIAEMSRPQDWGDKAKWMHVVYTYEAHGYRSTCHCWLDHYVSNEDHEAMFKPLVEQILLPGVDEDEAAGGYMKDDDFWDESWGEMPPYIGEDEPFDE